MTTTLLLHAHEILSGLHAVDLPNPDPTQPPGMGKISTIMGWVKYIGYAMVAMSIMGVGAMFAMNWSGRGPSSHLGTLGGALAGTLLIGAAASIVGGLAS